MTMVKPKKRPIAPQQRIIHRQTWQAAFILILSIGTSIIWNQYYEQELSLFWRYACRIAQCHALLRNQDRTHVVVRKSMINIPAGTLLLEIPRKFLITESDARRKLRISDGNIALAIYLAQLAQGKQHDVSKELLAYIRILPKNFDYHPITWSVVHLTNELGTWSLTRHRVDRLRRMIDHEYEQQVWNVMNKTDYMTARLNVLTRSFGSSDEHAMVPILDLYDHRGSPNVMFQYKNDAYQIVSLQELQPGDVLYDSYGKRTDSDLFSKYGFVNRDGDDWMDASVAVHHNVLADNDVEPKLMLRYLQFDDGYDTCIYPNNVTEWEIKKQKFLDLMAIANQEKRWVVRYPPKPELPKRGLDAKHVFETCEIITRTSDTSKVRAALCMVRLVDLAHQRLLGKSIAIQSERETLQAVKIAAMRSIQGMDRTGAKMRTDPCPIQSLAPLLDA